jgi:hypothetical protein
MADLLDKKPGVEHKTPVAPEKQRLDLRPRLRRPPAPRINRWIQWMALFVVMAVGAVAAVVLMNGDEEVTAYDRGAEHGAYTALAVRDLSGVDLTSRYAGLDPIFDPAVVPEHGEFTAMAFRDLTGVTFDRFAALDANLDPDVILGAGYHTVMPPTWSIPDVQYFAGLDANLDPDVILGAGYHTLMPPSWSDTPVDRFVGQDANLDP